MRKKTGRPCNTQPLALPERITHVRIMLVLGRDRSLFKQIELSTVANKNATQPFALTLTSFCAESRVRIPVSLHVEQRLPADYQPDISRASHVCMRIGAYCTS
eukprot:SAG25_NODE_430_length_8134_cov_59.362290_5_plen_103_part_00